MTAMCHTSMTPVTARNPATAKPVPRTISTASRMRRCGMRSAATPPNSTAITRPRLEPTATNDRSMGVPPSSTTCHTAATIHAPALSSDAARAIVSRRYCPEENGRRARGRREASVIGPLFRVPRTSARGIRSAVGFVEPFLDEVVGDDAPDRTGLAAEHDALGADDRTLLTHAVDELAVGHAGGHEERVVAAHQVVELVDAVAIESGRLAAGALGVVLRRELALHEAAQCLDGARGGDALGAAADADAHVDARLVACGVDATGDVAVADQSRARARFAYVGDELLVARAVQNRDAHLPDVLAFRGGERAQVLADGLADVDDADARGIRHDLVHVEDG